MTKKLSWLVYAIGMILLANWFVTGHQGLDTHRVHGWNWYHYWIGSKYHQELGYYEIYEQTVAAWKEMGSDPKNYPSARNQHTYKVERIKDGAPYVRNELWTDARWTEFKTDLQKLHPRQAKKKWRQCILDRGYNASPAWNTPAGWITNSLDVGNKNHLRLAKSFDLVALFAIALLLPLAFGPTRSIAAIWIALGVANNPTRVLGSFIQYDWIVLVLGSIALIRVRKHGVGGFLLGAATALRIFPAVFFAAMVARALLDLLLTRRLPVWLPRLAAGFGLALVLGFGLGSSGPRGADSWVQWQSKISIHNHFHKSGDGRVGLNHIFTSLQGPTGKVIPRISQRFKNLEKTRTARLALAAILLVLLAAACWNRDELDCFVLAVAAMFVLTVSSRYYWSALGLLPLLGSRRGDRTSLLIGIVMSTFMLTSYYAFCEGLDHTYIKWRTQNMFMLGTFLVGLSALAWQGFRNPSYDPRRDVINETQPETALAPL